MRELKPDVYESIVHKLEYNVNETRRNLEKTDNYDARQLFHLAFCAYSNFLSLYTKKENK